MKQLSEEQLDKLIRTLVNSAAADDATVKEIADSPATWWGVHRQISEQKGSTLSPLPPIGKMLRWLAVGVPVAAAAALAISFFVFRPAGIPDHIVSSVIQPIGTAVVNTPEITPSINTVSVPSKTIQNPAKREKQKPAREQGQYPKVKPEVTAAANNKTEIKTEFIALSYALDPESGQIVRVKVPSSMMVSLGLVASVKKPSDLVDAEVLVGDDGLTRAIRFIR